MTRLIDIFVFTNLFDFPSIILPFFPKFSRMAPGMMVVKSNLNITNWSIGVGYDKVSNSTTYPFRSFNAGYRGGLRASIQIERENLNYYCQQHGLGFKLILSVPGDSYRISQQSFQIPLFEDVRIAIKPKLVITSKQLRKYKPDQRQCFYHSERKLRFFKSYSQNNCELECLSNFTKKACGCVRFFMPSRFPLFCLKMRLISFKFSVILYDSILFRNVFFD